MRPLTKIVSSVLIMSLVAGLVAGCAQLPTAPVTSEQVNPGSAARVASGPGSAAAAAVNRGAQPAQPDGLLGPISSIGGGLIQLVLKVVNIVGSIAMSQAMGRD